MVFIPTDEGTWVDENYERLARVIIDYDHNLRLGYIPPDKRTREDKKPYCIMDMRLNEPIMYASELDKPHEILAKLFSIDNQKTNVLDQLEKQDVAQKIMQNKEWLDKLEEGHDKTNFLLNTPLHYIKLGKDTHGNTIKMDETRRRI